jgi:hypothetical protein
MSSCRTIIASLKIPLTAISKRIHHTLVQYAPPSLNTSISKNIVTPSTIENSAKFSSSVNFKDGKAYPVGRQLSAEEFESLKAKFVPHEQIVKSLEIAEENHRRSVYG